MDTNTMNMKTITHSQNSTYLTMNTITLVILIVGAVALSSAFPADYGYEHHEHEDYPYKFSYSVHDPHTHDIKEQKEEGDGHGNVKGYYQLKESDGTERIVHYTADKHLGFVAHVDRHGKAQHVYEKKSYGDSHEYGHYESHGHHATSHQDISHGHGYSHHY